MENGTGSAGRREGVFTFPEVVGGDRRCSGGWDDFLWAPSFSEGFEGTEDGLGLSLRT